MEKNIKPINEQTWARMDALNDIRNEVMDMEITKILLTVFNKKTVDDSKIIDFARNAVYETVRQVVDIIDEHLICTYNNAPEIVYQTKGMTANMRFLARTIVSLQQAINFYSDDPKLYLYIRHLIDTRDAFIEELMEQDGVNWVDKSVLPDYLEFYTHDEDGEKHYYSFQISSPKSDKFFRRENYVRGTACKKIIDDIEDEFPEE